MADQNDAPERRENEGEDAPRDDAAGPAGVAAGTGGDAGGPGGMGGVRGGASNPDHRPNGGVSPVQSEEPPENG